MSAKNIKELVEERIAEDRQQAANLARELVLKHTVIGDSDISIFFPEVANTWSRPANLPAGVPLVHQIVLGPPTVFDLEPLQPKQFEERYHISIAAAEELAERGILIPNLYARNPKDWEGMDHLIGLVKRALVNGERVDAFFKARDFRYENFVTTHAEQLEKSVSELEKTNPDQVAVVLQNSRSTRERMPTVIGTRWAYLDVVAPQASEYVSQLIADSKLEDALKYIQVTKHVHVSPISAAIGGNFIWGKKDIAHLENVSGGIPEPIRFPKETHHYQKPEQLEFLIRRITGVRPIQVPKERVFKDWELQKLVQLFDDRDIVETKKMCFELMDTMSALAQQGEVDAQNVEDWARLHDEIRKQIESRERFGRTALESTVGGAIGILIEPEYGAAAAATVEAVASNYVDKVGRTILRFSSPDRHRFLHLLEQIERRPD